MKHFTLLVVDTLDSEAVARLTETTTAEDAVAALAAAAALTPDEHVLVLRWAEEARPGDVLQFAEDAFHVQDCLTLLLVAGGAERPPSLTSVRRESVTTIASELAPGHLRPATLSDEEDDDDD